MLLFMKLRMKYMAIKMPGDTFAWMRAKFDDPPNANHFELEASRVCVCGSNILYHQNTNGFPRCWCHHHCHRLRSWRPSCSNLLHWHFHIHLFILHFTAFIRSASRFDHVVFFIFWSLFAIMFRWKKMCTTLYRCV